MDDLLPADPKARRLALVVWGVGAVVGTFAVWWLSSYMDALTALAQTDREASLRLFRTRVMPALVVVVVVAVVSGALLMRQGLRVMRSDRGAGPRPSSGSPARVIGIAFVTMGFLLSSMPLAFLALVLWLLRGE